MGHEQLGCEKVGERAREPRDVRWLRICEGVCRVGSGVIWVGVRGDRAVVLKNLRVHWMKLDIWVWSKGLVKAWYLERGQYCGGLGGSMMDGS